MSNNVREQQAPSNAVEQRVAVLGAGSFGTAVGTLFARNGHRVTLLTRREERADSINCLRS